MADENNMKPQTFPNPVGQLALQKPTEFLGIQRLLNEVPYNDKAQLSSFEQQIYNLLKPNPQNLDGLVTFLRIQLMLGNHHKAKSIAHRIWELGGALNHQSEKSYINDLMNVGLIEMASILLKPYFENMVDDMAEYGHLFLKYGIESGNLNILEKVTQLLKDNKARLALNDFIGVYRHLNYADNFKNIQRAILENVKNTLCAYEFNLYTDRGFTDLEVLLYVGNENEGNYQPLNEAINLQTSAICEAKGAKKLNNLCIVVKLINEYSKPAV